MYECASAQFITCMYNTRIRFFVHCLQILSLAKSKSSLTSNRLSLSLSHSLSISFSAVKIYDYYLWVMTKLNYLSIKIFHEMNLAWLIFMFTYINRVVDKVDSISNTKCGGCCCCFNITMLFHCCCFILMAFFSWFLLFSFLSLHFMHV